MAAADVVVLALIDPGCSPQLVVGSHQRGVTVGRLALECRRLRAALERIEEQHKLRRRQLLARLEPVVEHDDRRYLLRPVDAIAAGKTRRKRPAPERKPTVPFDPPGALLDRVVGRPPRHRLPEED